MDDEPLVRSFIRRLLVHNGFAAIEASSGPSGLSLLREMRGGVAAVVTNVEMPGMDGIAFANAVRSDFAAIPIVFMSAVPGWTRWQQALSNSALLQKPFRNGELVEAIRRLLPSTGQSAPPSLA